MHFWWFGNDSLPYCHCEHPWNPSSFDRMTRLAGWAISWDENKIWQKTCHPEWCWAVKVISPSTLWNNMDVTVTDVPVSTVQGVLKLLLCGSWDGLQHSRDLDGRMKMDEDGWMDIHQIESPIFFNHTNQKIWSPCKSTDFFISIVENSFMVCVLQSMKSEQLS